MPFIAMRRGDAMAVSELKDCLGMDRRPRAGDGRPSRGMRFPEKGRSRGNRRQGAGGAGSRTAPPASSGGEDGTDGTSPGWLVGEMSRCGGAPPGGGDSRSRGAVRGRSAEVRDSVCPLRSSCRCGPRDDTASREGSMCLPGQLSQHGQGSVRSVSYTHLRAHETDSYLVCRLLLEKKKK